MPVAAKWRWSLARLVTRVACSLERMVRRLELALRGNNPVMEAMDIEATEYWTDITKNRLIQEKGFDPEEVRAAMGKPVFGGRWQCRYNSSSFHWNLK